MKRIFRVLCRIVEREAVIVERLVHSCVVQMSRLALRYAGFARSCDDYLGSVSRTMVAMMVLLSGWIMLVSSNIENALNTSLFANMFDLMNHLHSNLVQLTTVVVVPLHCSRAVGDSLARDALRLRESIRNLLIGSASVLRQRATVILRRRAVHSNASKSNQENERGEAQLTPLQIAVLVLLLDLLLRYPSTKLWSFLWDRLFP